MKTKKLPKSVMAMIGTEQAIKGALFSRKNILPETKFKIVDARMSDAIIMNLNSKKEYRAFELLVKNDSMSRARWTRPFTIRP